MQLPAGEQVSIKRGTSVWALRCAALLVLCAAAATCRAQGWLLTQADGEASVLDGVSRLAATPGLRLAPGTLLETTAKTTLMRIENADQTSIDLGPETRAMLAPPGFPARAGKAPALYLLQGWVKVTVRGKTPAAGVVAPGLELMPLVGAVVLQVLPGAQGVFAELGRVEVLERRLPGPPLALAAGEFYVGEGTARGSVVSRPLPAWAKQVPRAFRDPIPLRASAFSEPPGEIRPLPAPDYAWLADWLGAEPAVRRSFPRRFAPLTRNPDFRRAVQNRMAAHPEWDVVLNPPPPKPK